ncbi:551_t:CDS:1 [Dentiscutata erythropus]|uniref:551_t:CDS:1 n=1 Tax=Dentiscutata erythropus TaxID=1348616 RepID=A0A9N9JWC5_9GLOM|nr:551_t:CDS:1 [Dentiscutata erythropus]
MNQLFDFKAMKDAGINFSVEYLVSDDIPRDYEKTSEFRYIKKLVKKLNKSKFLDYFNKYQECAKLFHDPDLGSYCKKHILNKLGCCRNHCCIDEGAGHCILHCIKKFKTYDLFDSDLQSENDIASDD